VREGGNTLAQNPDPVIVTPVMPEPSLPEVPDLIPTIVAFRALNHVLNHGHDGVDPIQHFAGALLDELGLTDRELAAAEQAVIKAMTGHPRDQDAIDSAMAGLKRLQMIRKKKAL
jgi:hypothetical protein